MKKIWYAIQRNSEDDWGTGSFDEQEARKMAIEREYTLIAVIDANYDKDGNPTTDGECIEEIQLYSKQEIVDCTVDYLIHTVPEDKNSDKAYVGCVANDYITSNYGLEYYPYVNAAVNEYMEA